MSLSCIQDNYKAAQLHSIIYWCKRDYDAKWKELLEFDQLDVPLQSPLSDKAFNTAYSNNLRDPIKIPLNIWCRDVSKTHLERKDKPLRSVTMTAISNQHSLTSDLKY